MKAYEDLDPGLKSILENIVEDDKYGLNAITLYHNIFRSSGASETIAHIYDVPEELVKLIKIEGDS